MQFFPAALQNLADQFARLPGIGGKTAQRLAFHVLSLPMEDAEEFAAAIVEALTGFAILDGMAPISEGFATVGAIAIVLAGAFPLVHVITKVLKKPLMAVGKLLHINETAAAGLIASLANSIATFGMVKDMDSRGKVVNIAFAVSAAFVFGDHLGFTAGFAPEILPAMILGKLAGGVSAVGVALLLTREKKGKA